VRLRKTWRYFVVSLVLGTLPFAGAESFGVAALARMLPPWGGLPTIETLGLAWDFTAHERLRIRIVPNRSSELWRDSFIQDAYESLVRWKECIESFTHRYGFSRVNRINFSIYIDGVNASSAFEYDVIIQWSETLLNRNRLAQTLLVSEPSQKIHSATITLAVMTNLKGPQRVLSNSEMRTIVAEEFGHALGLGHADSEHDLMSGFGSLDDDVCHTTLDVYALAIVYAYLDEQGFRSPGKMRVSLSGTGIPYAHLDDGM